jgi:hypothetical protein
MKNLVLLFALSLCVNAAFADNLFQDTNPFPQTTPQRMNNLYEAQPAVIQKEESKKPEEKRSWFKRNKTHAQDTYKNELPKYPVNEGGSNDGSFYVFK